MAGFAYVDESKRGPYLMCAYVATSADKRAITRALRELATGGRLHMKDESDGRKRLILKLLCELEISSSLYWSRIKPQHQARALIIEHGIWPKVVKERVQAIVFEAEDGQDERDRQLLYRLSRRDVVTAEFKYGHNIPAQEPLLWIPDAIAWAYGEGGDWKRRVSPLIADAVNVDEL